MTIRIETLREKVIELGYDAYLVAEEMDVSYLTSIPNPQEQLLLIKPGGNDCLYTLSDGFRTATNQVGNECEIKAADVGQPSLDLLLEDLPKLSLHRLLNSKRNSSLFSCLSR